MEEETLKPAEPSSESLSLMPIFSISLSSLSLEVVRILDLEERAVSFCFDMIPLGQACASVVLDVEVDLLDWVSVIGGSTCPWSHARISRC